MKNLIRSTIIVVIQVIIIFAIAGGSRIYAQSLKVDPNEGDSGCATAQMRENNPDCINFGQIDIPLFLSFEFIENFTPLSYIALGANFLFVGLTLFWTVLVIRAAIEYMQSMGNEDQIAGANKRIRSVFASISILFFSIVALIIVASFLGLGNFFSWPKKFSQCDDGTFYLTKVLELEAASSQKGPLSEEFIDSQCF